MPNSLGGHTTSSARRSPGGSLDDDPVAGPYGPAGVHDAHDPGPPHDGASASRVRTMLQQAVAEAVDLAARIAQPGHLDEGRCPDPQPRAGRQREQIDAGGGDVLPKISGGDRIARPIQLGE